MNRKKEFTRISILRVETLKSQVDENIITKYNNSFINRGLPTAINFFKGGRLVGVNQNAYT